ELDAAEVPVGELGGEVGRRRIAAPGRAADRLHHLRALEPELLGAEPMADDLGLREELVAPAMVAVAMRVHDTTRRLATDARVGRDQVTRMWQIPEGVDDETAAGGDEAGVAAPETAVFLEARVDGPRQLDELHAGRVAPRADPSQSARAPLPSGTRS